jgi:YaaC-like Protein
VSKIDWHRCKFIESGGNLRPLVKKRFGREPNASLAREIAACIQQGRLFYEAAAEAPLEIRPLQQFYGMLGFSRSLVVASQLRSLSTLRPAHGLRDVSHHGARIADMRVKIQGVGTFQEFNDVVAELTRLCYIDNQTRRRAIYLPTAKSDKLNDLEISFRDLLGRIPGLETLYRMTYRNEAYTDRVLLDVGIQENESLRIRIDDPEVFNNRESLKRIVTRWRQRYPFLKKWRLNSAEQGWGNSVIHFRNIGRADIDEFSEEYLMFEDLRAHELPVPDDKNAQFRLEDGLEPLSGGFGDGKPYAMSPINGHHISEFSIQYLALFLLSSLVRYRPQSWTRAISRSAVPNEPADDESLSLIERFLDLNQATIPEMVIRVLNPDEDYTFV